MTNRVRFSKKENNLIRSKDLCRIATNSQGQYPHLVTVGFLFRNGLFYIPANNQSVKIKNIRRNNKITLLVDDEKSQSGVMVQSTAEIIPGYDILEIMRTTKGWTNSPANSIVIKAMPVKKTSWFLKNRFKVSKQLKLLQ